MARPSVLVLDDDVFLLRALQRSLASDCDLAVEMDGAVALRRALSEPFSAIVVDVQMDRMSGAEFYRALVAAAPSLAERVIFMSGHVARAPFDKPLLRKPFSARAALDAITADRAAERGPGRSCR